VWEVGEDTFAIWGGEVGSPASFKGRFSGDRNTMAASPSATQRAATASRKETCR